MTKSTQVRLFKHERIDSQAARIRRFVLANPKMDCAKVAEKFGVDVQTIYNARHTLRKYSNKTIERLNLRSLPPAPQITEVPSATVTVSPAPEPKGVNIDAVHAKRVDMVNHPPHYKVGGIETIEYIKAKLSKEEYRGYLKGNILKYGSRVGYKDSAAQDAGKLAWYAQRLAELGE